MINMTTTDPTGRTRIWFIRHGESEANRNLHLVSGRSNHTPLSPAGREQAQALGVALLDCAYLPDAIYTSPALRTVTTADLALRAMGITDSAQPDGRLQELDRGEWTGLPRDQVYSVANQPAIAAAGVNFKPPGGESMHDVGLRMREWALDIPTQHGGGTVLAFTHGVAIRCLIGLEENWPEERIWQTRTACRSPATSSNWTSTTVAPTSSPTEPVAAHRCVRNIHLELMVRPGRGTGLVGRWVSDQGTG